MFEKSPEQSRERKYSLCIGVVSVSVSPMCFLSGWVANGFAFAFLTLLFFIPPIFFGQASF